MNAVGELNPVVEVDPLSRYAYAPRLESGQTVGERFVVIGRMLDGERVIQGGHADIYRAVDLEKKDHPRPSVIKVQKSMVDEVAEAHFAKEAELHKALSERTEKVVEFLDGGLDRDRYNNPFYWLAMEEAGDSLDRIIFDWNISHERPDIDRVQNILVPALGGVAIMHDEFDFGHKDIKPENIFEHKEVGGKTGDLGMVGVAKTVNVQALRDHNIPLEVVTQPLADTELVYGTPAFTPPEGLVYGSKVDPKSADVYAGGLTLHLAIGGQKPLEKERSVRGRQRLVRETPQIEDYDNTLVPREIAELAIQMMGPEPDRPTMREAVSVLQNA